MVPLKFKAYYAAFLDYAHENWMSRNVATSDLLVLAVALKQVAVGSSQDSRCTYTRLPKLIMPTRQYIGKSSNTCFSAALKPCMKAS